MAKRKKKKANICPVAAAADVGDKLRAALRSIVRDWQTLSGPLPVDELTSDHLTGAPRFRVRGAESFEELQESVIQFAGRVWQLKDGLIKWLQTRPLLRIVFSDAKTGAKLAGTGGQGAERIIEEASKLSIPLMICADLYNTHKHYDDCNRSGYQPFLNGVQFDGKNVGMIGIRYDGARKTGEMTIAKPVPVPVLIEIHSGNPPFNFGNAVVVVGRAFNYWIPLIRQMELLSPEAIVDKAILEDVAIVEESVKNSTPFKPNDP